MKEEEAENEGWGEKSSETRRDPDGKLVLFFLFLVLLSSHYWTPCLNLSFPSGMSSELMSGCFNVTRSKNGLTNRVGRERERERKREWIVLEGIDPFFCRHFISPFFLSHPSLFMFMTIHPRSAPEYIFLCGGGH